MVKWRHFWHFSLFGRPFQRSGPVKAIRFSNPKVFYMKFAEEFENVISFIIKCVFDVIVTSSWRQFYNFNCILQLSSQNDQFKSYGNDQYLFLTCFRWEKMKFLLFFKFDVIMTLLWRHFYHSFIGNHKIINSNRMKITNTLF